MSRIKLNCQSLFFSDTFSTTWLRWPYYRMSTSFHVELNHFFFRYIITIASIYGNDAGRAMQMWVDHGDFGLMNVIAEVGYLGWAWITYSDRLSLLNIQMDGCVQCISLLASFLNWNPQWEFSFFPILLIPIQSISMHVVYSSILDRMHPHSSSLSVRLATISLICISAFSTSFFLIAPGK